MGLILRVGYKHAAVAQLEERIPAKDEVTGSIPVGCTISPMAKSRSRRASTREEMYLI